MFFKVDLQRYDVAKTNQKSNKKGFWNRNIISLG